MSSRLVDLKLSPVGLNHAPVGDALPPAHSRNGKDAGLAHIRATGLGRSLQKPQKTESSPLPSPATPLTWTRRTEAGRCHPHPMQGR